MKALTKIAWSVALTAMLLAGLLASAQQGKSPSGKKDAANGSASAQPGSQSQSAGKDASGNKGKATNPQYEEKGSGTNPMYEGKDSKPKTQNPAGPQAANGQREKSGTDSAGSKKNANPSPQMHGNHKDVMEYKDGEDGVTHTRPGTHK